MTDKSSRKKLAYAFAALSLGLLVFASTIAAGLNTGVANAQATTSSQDTQQQDAASRVALNMQYMTRAQQLFSEQLVEEEKVAAYQKQRENATSEQEKADLDRKIQASKEKLRLIDSEFQKIQELNFELFKLPPAFEEKFYSVEKNLIDKYLNNSSKTYIGENPVVLVTAHPLTRDITLTIDTDKIAPDKSNVPAEKEVEDIPIKLHYGKPVEISCNPDNRLTGVCRPVLGGVSTAEQNNVPNNSKNTIGYKATKNGQDGFVMAGHSAVGSGKVIVQPYNDATKRVGAVPSSGAFCYNGFTCDFAWVDLDSGISIQDDIYTTCYTCRYDIAYKDPESAQQPGLLVKKAGVGLGVTIGQVTANSPNNHYIETDMDAAAGDSGAPVFSNTDVIARLKGVVFSASSDFQNTYYFPQDYVESQIGAVASTV